MPDDKSPILFTPESFTRHDGAARYIEDLNRTRAPWPSGARRPSTAFGAWGILASGGSISAASGVTLGSGSVKLCDQSGTVYPEDETVTVYNAGDSISASGGDKIVPLEWTAGEWSTCVCGTTTFPCFPCDLPEQDLTLDYTNVIIGNGSTTLYYIPNTWTSQCDNGLIYRAGCTGGVLGFQITYFISGTCPTGQTQVCFTGGGNGSRLIRSTTTCSPLSVLYTTGSGDCTFLYNSGYRSFTIHE